MKNILFPTDFSENAQVAWPFAVDIARKNNAHITVFNSYDLPYSDRSISTSLLDVMKENAETNMNAFEAMVKNTNVSYNVIVKMGNPIRMIKEMTKKNDIDLIVMGTKGASGIEEFLIGSNAASVIQSVDIPVLVVPPQSELKEIKTIVLASDLNLKGKALPLERLKTFASLFNANIEILHIQGENGPKAGSRDFVESMLADAPHSYTIVREENVEEAILNHCEAKGANILSAITKRYNFFESLFHKSLTSKLAYHSSIPLLALHEPK